MKKLLSMLLLTIITVGLCFAQGVQPKQTTQINTLPQDSAKDFLNGLNQVNPYYPPVSGLAHNMNAKGVIYSVYVPEGQYPWAPGVIILTPNNTTAKEFALSEKGRTWMSLADKYKFSFGIVEPEKGKWNIDGKSGRDEVEALINVYTQMRSKSQNLNLPFTMDKSRVTLVGYEDGATTALAVAAGESSAFCAVAAINSVGSNNNYIKELDQSYCFPFPADGLKAKEEIKLSNGTLKMPVWFIGNEDEVAFNYYLKKNKTDKITYTSNAVRHYNSTENVASVFVTTQAKAVSEEDLWTQFLSQYTRPLGVEGGHLDYAMNFATRKDGTGYILSEENYDGFLRRYITYIPSTYDPSKKASMVMVCHGYTATMYALAEESRWCDVAEENNIIVVFPQAFPNIVATGNIPAPAWMSPNLFKGGEGNTNDIKFLTHVIETTKQNYNIDKGRVYGTGHSNGCAMILSLASENPDLFTAIAPIGYPSAGTGLKSDTKLPTWLIVGEYDGAGMSLEEGNKNDKAIDYWTDFNDLSKEKFADTQSENTRFNTRTWKTASGAPLFKFTGVNRSAHSYFPEESEMIWNDFFSRYTKNNDILYYDRTEVNDSQLKQIVTQVSDNVWCISEFNLVNSFLIVGENKAALIDTCCGLGNIREVAESLTDKPIMVLLTHGHGDHTGGIYHFSQDSQIFMNDLDKELPIKSPMTNAGRTWYVNSRGPVRFPGHEEEMRATIPTTEPDMSFTYTTVQDKDKIDLGGNTVLEVITTPGHTDGSVCYLDRQNKILFSGDTLNKSIILFRQPNNGTKLIEILNNTMKKIWAYEDSIERLAVGHDAITSSKTVIQDYLNMTNGLLDGSLIGSYEEVAFRAGDVVRQGNAELWYQCDK